MDHFHAEECQKPKCLFTQQCPEYLVAPIPALQYKAFTNPRPVDLDYRRYLSLSYNAGVADKESEQVRNNFAFKNNNQKFISNF